MTIINFGQGLPLELDHIYEHFDIKLVNASGVGLTTSGNMDFVDLYFAYESHSLF